MKAFNQQRGGWTLMEVIAALGVIVIGLTAALFLTSYNLTIQGQSQKRLQAAHLAREVIEFLRASRDSNWLAGNSSFASWTDWYNRNNPAYRLIFDLNSDSFIVQAVLAADPAGCGANCIIRQNLDPSWPILGLNDGNHSSFSRFFTIKPICWDSVSQSVAVQSSTNSDCSAYPTLAGYQIEATVAWEFNGSWKQVQLVERLYDWK